MKRTFYGKRCYTSTAILIGRRVHGEPEERDYLDEGLYITPRLHHFFIVGEGWGYTKCFCPPAE